MRNPKDFRDYCAIIDDEIVRQSTYHLPKDALESRRTSQPRMGWQIFAGEFLLGNVYMAKRQTLLCLKFRHHPRETVSYGDFEQRYDDNRRIGGIKTFF
ncbi:MAG: hypothetical protein CM15mP42_10290 [Methanobacteriota archaeon]|nr:MAG: hypothetical protein CM15mP42_10290 [Euryarchaeota archaeon]